MDNDFLCEEHDLKFKHNRKVNNKSSNELPHIIETFEYLTALGSF